VKNGWHLEQIATRRFGTVERVGYVAPHAHTIEVSTYLGWISAFMHFSCGIAAEIFGFKVDTHGLTPVALAKEVCIYLEGCMPSNSL
jgi:hypothetical protein